MARIIDQRALRQSLPQTRFNNTTDTINESRGIIDVQRSRANLTAKKVGRSTLTLIVFPGLLHALRLDFFLRGAAVAPQKIAQLNC
jgi:hypothetical protein